METTPSPLPWTYKQESEDDYADYNVRDATGKSIMCDTQYYPWALSRTDAAYAVKAVNVHAALVEAIEQALDTWDADLKREILIAALRLAGEAV